MRIEPISSEELITALRAGRVEVLEDVYTAYRRAFFQWAGHRFHAKRPDLEDAWQEAVIAFYVQVISGQLVHLQVGVRVWLFTVGYRHLLKQNRKTKRIFWKARIDEGLPADAPGNVQEEVAPEKKESLEQAMKTLSSQCREMLLARYFLEKSIAEIQEDWEFSSANTTSATLSRCMKRLKNLITNTQKAIIR